MRVLGATGGRARTRGCHREWPHADLQPEDDVLRRPDAHVRRRSRQRIGPVRSTHAAHVHGRPEPRRGSRSPRRWSAPTLHVQRGPLRRRPRDPRHLPGARPPDRARSAGKPAALGGQRGAALRPTPRQQDGARHAPERRHAVGSGLRSGRARSSRSCSSARSRRASSGSSRQRGKPSPIHSARLSSRPGSPTSPPTNHGSRPMARPSSSPWRCRRCGSGPPRGPVPEPPFPTRPRSPGTISSRRYRGSPRPHPPGGRRRPCRTRCHRNHRPERRCTSA